MKFKEAIKSGKATLDGDGYVEFNEDGVLVDNNGNKQYFNKEYLNGTDWEIYVEPKDSLFGKHLRGDEVNYSHGLIFQEKDVKDALKMFMAVVTDRFYSRGNTNLVEIAKEIFGEELIE